jgi:heme A synthase
MDDIGQVLHLFHRFLAFVTVLGLLWAGWCLRYLRHAAVLSIVQVLMGLVVIVAYEGGALEFQVTVGAVHQLFAIIIFAALVWTFWQPDMVK